MTSEATEFSRLLIGESLTLAVPRSGSKELMFSRYMFRVLGASHPCLVHQNAGTYFLQQGRNMVEGHPESDVVVDADFHEVSRAHRLLNGTAGRKLR